MEARFLVVVTEVGPSAGMEAVFPEAVETSEAEALQVTGNDLNPRRFRTFVCAARPGFWLPAG